MIHMIANMFHLEFTLSEGVDGRLTAVIFLNPTSFYKSIIAIINEDAKSRMTKSLIHKRLQCRRKIAVEELCVSLCVSDQHNVETHLNITGPIQSNIPTPKSLSIILSMCLSSSPSPSRFGCFKMRLGAKKTFSIQSRRRRLKRERFRDDAIGGSELLLFWMCFPYSPAVTEVRSVVPSGSMCTSDEYNIPSATDVTLP